MAMDEPAKHDQSNGGGVFLYVPSHRGSSFWPNLSGDAPEKYCELPHKKEPVIIQNGLAGENLENGTYFLQAREASNN